MTRKDYNKTAEILKNFYDNYPTELVDFKNLVFDFADWFAEDNPNFSEEKFLDKIYGKVA